jgi:hypothetical protein
MIPMNGVVSGRRDPWMLNATYDIYGCNLRGMQKKDANLMYEMTIDCTGGETSEVENADQP